MGRIKKGDVVIIKAKAVEWVNPIMRKPLLEPKIVSEVVDGPRFKRIWLDEVCGMSFTEDQLEHYSQSAAL